MITLTVIFIVRHDTHVVVAILARTTRLAPRPNLIWAASVLIALQPTFTQIGDSVRTSSQRTITERESGRRLPEEQDTADDAHARPG